MNNFLKCCNGDHISTAVFDEHELSFTELRNAEGYIHYIIHFNIRSNENNFDELIFILSTSYRIYLTLLSAQKLIDWKILMFIILLIMIWFITKVT